MTYEERQAQRRAALIATFKPSEEAVRHLLVVFGIPDQLMPFALASYLQTLDNLADEIVPHVMAQLELIADQPGVH